jgi:mannan endo-1,4-beta-mannosidase
VLRCACAALLCALTLPPTDFFSSPACRQLFRNFATALLTRVNTITGVAYRDDPTIFAWELINEPRVPQDWSGDVLQNWIVDLAAHIKSIDPAHMLTTGVEVRAAACAPLLRLWLC